ncbi:hypothetical protein [Actinopolymorpha alba]|uniref:hypothetical protein n=1 Tax=Actinopolymorpha alba TaxID=533267 RepID=UPI0012F6CD2A|nr:hypothetical protein [Actinopolymorpha alba]
MRRRRSMWLAVLTAIVVAGWQAQIAQAAPLVGTARHCVAGLAAVPVDGVAGTSKVTDFTCYDTFAESIRHATGGRVTVASGAESVTTKQLLTAGAISTGTAAAAQPLLGIEYQNGSFGGESLVLYGSSGTGCYAGTWYGFPRMSDLGFDNRISSARAYSNCIGKHHDGTSYTGDYVYCESSCSSLGAMNDRTSSIKFF